VTTERPFWSLVYTRNKWEESARGHLEQQGFEVFLPRIRKTVRHAGRRRERIEPMFPRYLFVHLDPGVEDWSPIRSTVGVTTLVRFGREPGIVPAEIVDGLRARADEHGIIGSDDPGDFEAGQNVRIVEGPFEGYQAIIQAKLARERVDILLALVGQYVTARVRAADLAAQ
jgi:transcriptional antiterminator RfaH